MGPAEDVKLIVAAGTGEIDGKGTAAAIAEDLGVNGIAVEVLVDGIGTIVHLPGSEGAAHRHYYGASHEAVGGTRYGLAQIIDRTEIEFVDGDEEVTLHSDRVCKSGTGGLRQQRRRKGQKKRYSRCHSFAHGHLGWLWN